MTFLQYGSPALASASTRRSARTRPAGGPSRTGSPRRCAASASTPRTGSRWRWAARAEPGAHASAAARSTGERGGATATCRRRIAQAMELLDADPSLRASRSKPPTARSWSAVTRPGGAEPEPVVSGCTSPRRRWRASCLAAPAASRCPSGCGGSPRSGWRGRLRRTRPAPGPAAGDRDRAGETVACSLAAWLRQELHGRGAHRAGAGGRRPGGAAAPPGGFARRLGELTGLPASHRMRPRATPPRTARCSTTPTRSPT